MIGTIQLCSTRDVAICIWKCCVFKAHDPRPHVFEVQVYNPNPGGFGRWSHPIGAERVVSVAVVFDSAQRSRYTHHDHTSSRFRDRDIIITQEGLGAQPTHRGRVRYIQSKYVRASVTQSIHSGSHIVSICNCREDSVISRKENVIFLKRSNCTKMVFLKNSLKWVVLLNYYVNLPKSSDGVKMHIYQTYLTQKCIIEINSQTYLFS